MAFPDSSEALARRALVPLVDLLPDFVTEGEGFGDDFWANIPAFRLLSFGRTRLVAGELLPMDPPSSVEKVLFLPLDVPRLCRLESVNACGRHIRMQILYCDKVINFRVWERNTVLKQGLQCTSIVGSIGKELSTVLKAPVFKAFRGVEPSIADFMR